MPIRRDLSVTQGNHTTIDVAITDSDTGGPYDLTGVTVEVYLKATAGQADNDAGTILLTSPSNIQINSAVNGTCTVTIIAANLPTAGRRWWRLDCVASGQRRTVMFGPMYVTAV